MEYIFLLPIEIAAVIIWRYALKAVADHGNDERRKCIWQSILTGAILATIVIGCGRIIGQPTSIVISPLRYELFLGQIAFVNGVVAVGMLKASRVLRRRQNPNEDLFSQGESTAD